jgi:adhesin HecA-like repeat protein
MELTFMQETTASGFLFTTFTFDTFDNRNSITQTGTVHASSGKLFNRHLKLTSYFFKKVSNVKVKYIILNGFAKNSSKKNFNSDYIEVAKKMKISYYLIMELTFMQETTASGFLFTTFDTFDNRNSITQTGTVHASSGKLFNRHLKLTSYFFKKVINVKVKVKYIILNGFAKNSRAKKI